jgi:hypothetical protein
LSSKKDTEDSGEEFEFIKPETDCRRAYRINPSTDEPIHVEIQGKLLEVVDISSGGLSIRNEGLPFKQPFDITFRLPILEEDVVTKMSLIRPGEENIAHGQFVGLSEEMEDLIHKYVLDRQKEDLQF